MDDNQLKYEKKSSKRIKKLPKNTIKNGEFSLTLKKQL